MDSAMATVGTDVPSTRDENTPTDEAKAGSGRKKAEGLRGEPIVKPASQQAMVPSHRQVSPPTAGPPLEILPRQIQMHGRYNDDYDHDHDHDHDHNHDDRAPPRPLEAWLTLRYRGLGSNDNGDDDDESPAPLSLQPAAFSVRCPHPRMLIEPSEGVMGGAATAGKASQDVRVRLSLPAEHAQWLRCTALEVEVAGGARKSVPVQVHCSQPARIIDGHEETSGKEGLYFKGAILNFGHVEVGSMETRKVRLCNGTYQDAALSICDPALPFVVLHHQLTIRHRAYVRLPVRFMPTVRGDFESVLAVSLIADGQREPFTCQVTLIGTAV